MRRSKVAREYVFPVPCGHAASRCGIRAGDRRRSRPRARPRRLDLGPDLGPDLAPDLDVRASHHAGHIATTYGDEPRVRAGHLSRHAPLSPGTSRALASTLMMGPLRPPVSVRGNGGTRPQRGHLRRPKSREISRRIDHRKHGQPHPEEGWPRVFPHAPESSGLKRHGNATWGPSLLRRCRVATANARPGRAFGV